MSMNRWSYDVIIRTPLDVRLRCPGRGANPVGQRNRLMGCVRGGTTISKGSMRSFRLRVESFDGGRDDANVSSELEDQVVDIRRRHGTQGW